MKQPRLGGLLAELYQGGFTHRVDVQTLETGDVNNPDWLTVRRGMEVAVQMVNAGERLTRSEQYEMRTTHQAFCDDAPEVLIGTRWVEVARRFERGWVEVEPQVAHTWIVQGKDEIPGVPEPTGQVRVDLHQMSPTVGAWER